MSEFKLNSEATYFFLPKMTIVKVLHLTREIDIELNMRAFHNGGI